MDRNDLNSELLEIIGHLGTALIQSLPSDDQIIMGHVRDAHTLAVALRRRINPNASAVAVGAPKSNVIAVGDHDAEYRHDLCAVAREMAVK